MTAICIPITTGSCREMIDDIHAAQQAGAEMIELRLDFLHEWNEAEVSELLAAAKNFSGKIIATCRIAVEGGQFDGEESERISRLEFVGLCDAIDYIDIEYQAWKASANIRQKIGLVCEVNGDSPRPRRQLILSQHDFERTPADLAEQLETIAAEPGHVAKIACKANTITDSLRMLKALRESAAKRPTIALSMGETGVLTRVLAKKFDALLTFASLSAGKESAPGQITLADTRELYRWDKIAANTKVYGVIGCPVGHSMSPAIHNAAFNAIGYNGVYLPLRIEPDYDSFKAFADFATANPWLDLSGCSVTIPHKENLLRYVRENGGQIEPLTERIGVANTLCIEYDGDQPTLSAYNTDYRGALDALCAGMGIDYDGLQGKRVAVIGAGGVSRAIVAGLRDCGAEVTIYNRTAAKAEKLADEFNATALPWEHRSELTADAVINCTSIGMWPNVDDTPLPDFGFAGAPAVFDTIYNPMETRLLREARAAGCTVIDGVAMFVGQAVAQFERWTGQSAPTGIMRKVVIDRLSQNSR